MTPSATISAWSINFLSHKFPYNLSVSFFNLEKNDASLKNLNNKKNDFTSLNNYKNKNIYTIFRGQLNFEPFFYFKIIADVKKVNLDYLNLKKINLYLKLKI